MKENVKYVIREVCSGRIVEISNYCIVKMYCGKKIKVVVFDGYVDDDRVTKIFCSRDDYSIITLNNATDEQVLQQINNMVRNAMEIIDENSIFSKVKKLFR